MCVNECEVASCINVRVKYNCLAAMQAQEIKILPNNAVEESDPSSRVVAPVSWRPLAGAFLSLSSTSPNLSSYPIPIIPSQALLS